MFADRLKFAGPRVHDLGGFFGMSLVIGDRPTHSVVVSCASIVAEFRRSDIGIVVRAALNTFKRLRQVVQRRIPRLLESFPGTQPWLFACGNLSFDKFNLLGAMRNTRVNDLCEGCRTEDRRTLETSKNQQERCDLCFDYHFNRPHEASRCGMGLVILVALSQSR